MIGLAVGLLVAPEKGEDTREALTDTAEKWKAKFDHLMGKGNAQLEKLRAMLGNEMEGVTDDVRNRILTILEEGAESTAVAAAKASKKEKEFKPI